MAVFKALERTGFPILLRIFCFEVGQQLQFGKQQHVSINVSFAGQPIYLPISPFQEKRILCAQLLKGRVTYRKRKGKAIEIFKKLCPFGKHQAQEFRIKTLFGEVASACKKCVD